MAVKLLQRLPGESLDSMTRGLETRLADRLVAAAEAGDRARVRELLDLVHWIEERRHLAALSARMN